MPPTLEVVEFSEPLLHLVQGFSCGNEPWAQAAAQWIQTPLTSPHDCALRSIAERGNSVWLYYDGAQLIGFGSMGSNEWPMPPGSIREEFCYIPQIAIASQFQGGPPGSVKTERYSHQIMSDLIARALLTPHNVLGLQVHELNKPAIKLYKNFDFHVIGKRRDHLRMTRILR